MDWIASPYFVLVTVTLATSVVTLFTGFGVGTVLAPVMAMYFDVKVAVFLAAVVHFFNNASRLYLYREYVDRGVIRRFGVISIVGAFLGSYAQVFIDSARLKAGFGFFLWLTACRSSCLRGRASGSPAGWIRWGAFCRACSAA